MTAPQRPAALADQSGRDPAEMLRRLERTDAPALAALWWTGASESARHEPAYAPRGSLASQTARLDGLLERAEIVGWGVFGPDGQLVGALTARPEPPSAAYAQEAALQILDADVAESARGRGVLRRLVEAAAAHARAAGLGELQLFWVANDERAGAAWRRLGFEAVVVHGRRRVPAAPLPGPDQPGAGSD